MTGCNIKKESTKSANFYFKTYSCHWSSAIYCFICIDKLKQRIENNTE